jgi:anti-sigma factor ChrR (cupin superfamily)
MSKKEWKPVAVNAADMVFGGEMSKLMPSYSELPRDYEGRHQWENWQSNWFFSGLKRYPVPREGIDRKEAMRHLSAIQGSMEPKHEHKVAAVAWLASQWFTSPDGEPIPEKKVPA